MMYKIKDIIKMTESILWFCRTSDSSSLSRITDSVLPILKNSFDITLLSNQSNISGIKNVLMGADTETVTYKDFMNSQTVNEETIRCLNMKYILVQIVDLIYDNNFKYLVICNGIYEIDWFTRILTSEPKFLTNKFGNKTKLVVWAPIDYIPTKKVIENAVKADLFLTMTPVMLDEIKKIDIGIELSEENSQVKFDHVGHGSDITTKTMPLLSRSELIIELNKLRTKKLINCKDPIKESDIIILNANNYGPLNKNEISVVNTPGTRKRLDITIKAFMKIMKPGIKLWIHTNLKSFFDMLAIEDISLQPFIDNIILSNNNLSNEDLSLIYQASQISLQTSFGEGWSLTNLEASLYRSLQVVPDFLACGYHYSCGRGLLIPVTRKTIKNEGLLDVIIGEVSVESTSQKLLEAIELLGRPDELNIILNNAYEYSKSYTWNSITNRLTDIIKNLN